MAIWTLKNGRLFYRPRIGKALFPTAMQVWQAVFSDNVLADNEPTLPSPARYFPKLEFSQFPAEMAVHLTGNLLRGFVVQVVLRSNNETSHLNRARNGEVFDQVIKDNVWYPVDLDGINTTNEALSFLNITPGKTFNLAQLIKLRSQTSFPVQIVDQTDPVQSATQHRSGTEGLSIEGLQGSLYPYQLDGVSFLQQVVGQGLGCILGDEMGLGKTLQVIALIQDEKNSARTPSLVIAPATLLENWRREFAIFAPRLEVLVHAGAKRFGSSNKLAAFDVIVTSYETAVRDEPLLSSVCWNLIAVDEAQNIKNPAAQRTLSVKRLPRRVSLAVTGTPVENRLADLWSLADFALPGLLGELSTFRAEFDDTATDAARLAPVVGPILLRRRITEVAKDLPPRIDIPQCIAMTHSMAEQYEVVRTQALTEYGAGAGLVALQRLRMFCTHPRVLERTPGDPALNMPKYERAIEILEEIFDKREKALIFCSYTEMADIFMADLPRRFASTFFGCIDGRVAISERQPLVDRFSDHEGPGALVLNPKAAGVGLNIAAANHVLHYNPEWNPAVEDQASARAYRRKQTRPVTVHHLYFADSVEEVIIGRLTFKRRLAEGAAIGHKGDATAADVARALEMSPLAKAKEIE